MSVTSSPGLLLLGHFDEKAAMAVLNRLCLCPDTRSSTLKSLWIEAKKRRGNEVARAGQLQLGDPPPELEPYLTRLLAQPRLAGGIDGMAIEVKMIDFRRVLAFQAGVFLDRVEAAEKAFRAVGPVEELAKICLPQDARFDPATLLIERQPFRVISRNANIKVLGTGFGQLHDETGQMPIAFLIGEGEPCIQVVEFRGRWYLRNGYHRLVGALRAGLDSVPALTLHAKSWADVSPDLGVGWFLDPRRIGLPALAQFSDAWAAPLRNFETVTEFSSKTESRPI